MGEIPIELRGDLIHATSDLTDSISIDMLIEAGECEGATWHLKKNQVQGRLDVSLCPFLRLSLAFPLAHDTRYRTKRLEGGGGWGDLRNPFTVTLFADALI